MTSPKQVRPTLSIITQAIEALPMYFADMYRVPTPIERPEAGYDGDDEESDGDEEIGSPRIVEYGEEEENEREMEASEGNGAEGVWHPQKPWLSSSERLLEDPFASPTDSSDSDFNWEPTLNGRPDLLYRHGNDQISAAQRLSSFQFASSLFPSNPKMRILTVVDGYECMMPSLRGFDKFKQRKYCCAAAKIFDPLASDEDFRNHFTDDVPEPGQEATGPSNHSSPTISEDGAPLISIEEADFRKAARGFFGPLDVDYLLAIQRGPGYTLESTDRKKAGLETIFDLLPHEPKPRCHCYWCDTYFSPTVELFLEREVAHDPHQWCNCPRCLFLARVRPNPKSSCSEESDDFCSPPPKVSTPPPALPPRPRNDVETVVAQLNVIQLAAEARMHQLRGDLGFVFDPVRSPKLTGSEEMSEKSEKSDSSARKLRKGLMRWVRNHWHSDDDEEKDEQKKESDEC